MATLENNKSHETDRSLHSTHEITIDMMARSSNTVSVQLFHQPPSQKGPIAHRTGRIRTMLSSIEAFTIDLPSTKQHMLTYCTLKVSRVLLCLESCAFHS